jgi:Ser/Thr protein kinase RdoA (MazF antagonist)
MRDEDKKSGASEELSDEARRKLYKPSVTPAQATTIIQALYAKPDGSDTIEVVRQLDSYDDVNFMVKLNDTLHLLKIHNGVESEDFLRAYEAAGHEYNKTGHMGSVIHLQTAIMDLLSVNDIPTSANLPTQEGMPVGLYELPVVSSKDSPRQLVVRLLSWVHGKLMASVPLMPVETIADTGRLLGKVHLVLNKLDQANLQSINILKDAPKRVKRRASLVQGREAKEDMVITDKIRQAQMWKIPDSGLDESLLRAARRYHQWDGKNTADLRNFVHHVTDEKRRSIVISIIDTFQHELIDSGDAQELRVGVNHGDFNDANVLLADDLSAKGVIDFGDSVER